MVIINKIKCSIGLHNYNHVKTKNYNITLYKKCEHCNKKISIYTTDDMINNLIDYDHKTKQVELLIEDLDDVL